MPEPKTPKRSRGAPRKDPRFRAISWPLSFMPPQILWIKEKSLLWGLNNSRFLQALVDRSMSDPLFVQNAVIKYCNTPDEYAGLLAEKTYTEKLEESLRQLIQQAIADNPNAVNFQTVKWAENLLADKK